MRATLWTGAAHTLPASDSIPHSLVGPCSRRRSSKPPSTLFSFSLHARLTDSIPRAHQGDDNDSKRTTTDSFQSHSRANTSPPGLTQQTTPTSFLLPSPHTFFFFFPTVPFATAGGKETKEAKDGRKKKGKDGTRRPHIHLRAREGRKESLIGSSVAGSRGLDSSASFLPFFFHQGYPSLSLLLLFLESCREAETSRTICITGYIYIFSGSKLFPSCLLWQGARKCIVCVCSVCMLFRASSLPAHQSRTVWLPAPGVLSSAWLTRSFLPSVPSSCSSAAAAQ